MIFNMVNQKIHSKMSITNIANLSEVTNNQKKTWSKGDFNEIAR